MKRKSKALKGFISLYSKLPAKDIDLCIEKTAKWKNTELTAFLLEYKENKFEKSSSEVIPASSTAGTRLALAFVSL